MSSPLFGCSTGADQMDFRALFDVSHVSCRLQCKKFTLQEKYRVGDNGNLEAMFRPHSGREFEKIAYRRNNACPFESSIIDHLILKSQIQLTIIDAKATGNPRPRVDSKNDEADH